MEIFNNLGRVRQELVPRDAGKIGIYVCGPTVQSGPHLGHGKYAVVFDVVRRYLEWLGFDVTYVMNVTDVDDKIIANANREGVDIGHVAERVAAEFDDVFDRLGIKTPDHSPRATEHIPEMVELIEQLVEKEHAYESEGDVYFSVRSFPEYGKLSGRDIDELRSGARVEPGELKRDPLDFAVWKAAKPGEPSWDSPWSAGRPGWHIECSAMASKYLGAGFDIHAGGQDLIFPHHENEIAQFEAATGQLFARIWMHNGMVNLDGAKMSKSDGNVIDLKGALEEYPPLAVRLFYLRTHYRKGVEFNPDNLLDATAALERLWAFRRRVAGPVDAEAHADSVAQFTAAMNDDFDVAGALGVLFEVVRDGNKTLDAGDEAGPWLAAYDVLAGVLGLLEPVTVLDDLASEINALATEVGVEIGPDVEATLDALVARRDAARAEKEWAVTDAIRDRLNDAGITVEDTADGARWHRR